MLATIFEMIEKILGFAGASFDARLSSRLSLMLFSAFSNKISTVEFYVILD